jgi:MFS family permease
VPPSILELGSHVFGIGYQPEFLGEVDIVPAIGGAFAQYDAWRAAFWSVFVLVPFLLLLVEIAAARPTADPPGIPLAPPRQPDDAARRCPATRERRFGSRLQLSRVHWVRPELVVEVSYLTWTLDHLLRQVVCVGLREDDPACAVQRPVPHPRSHA